MTNLFCFAIALRRAYDSEPPEEKALLQAKHRLEESEARNRKKERNARTRRLIQEGAILENVSPHIKEMDLDTLKRELMLRLRGM